MDWKQSWCWGHFQQHEKTINSKIISLTMSVDHRAIDGAVGAKFLQVFKKIIENPMLMSL